MLNALLAASLIAQVQPAPGKVKLGADTPDLTFADKRASTEFLAFRSAMLKLSSFEGTVDRDGALEKVVFDPNRAKVTGPGYSWLFANGTATLKAKGAKSTIKISKRKLSTKLAKVGVRMDPLLLSWAIGYDHAYQLTGPKAKVQFVGSTTIDRVPCIILKAKRPNLVMTLAIRKKDHLLAQSMAEVLDPNGRLVSSSLRKIRYQSANRPISAAKFSF